MLVTLETLAREIFSAKGFHWPGVFIISGFRSARLQAVINPAAPKSLHTRCPSMAADLRVGDLPASTTPTEFWAFLGTLWKSMGGRWGGDFKTPDPNHFEMRPEIVQPLPTPRSSRPRELGFAGRGDY